MPSTTVRARRVAEARLRPATVARIRATDELRRYIKVLDDNRIAATEKATLFEVGANRFVVVNGRIQRTDVTLALPMDTAIDTKPDGTVVSLICLCDGGDPNNDDCTFDVESPTSNHVVCKGTCKCIVMSGEVAPDGSHLPSVKVEL